MVVIDIPQTIEEWSSIHGEPIYEDNDELEKLNIQVVHCPQVPYEEQEGHIGIEQCVYDSKRGKRINYPNFVEAIAKSNRIICVNGTLFSPDGVISDAKMRYEITESLKSAGWTEVMDSPTTHILNSIKDTFHRDKLPVDKNVIPFANGDLHILPGQWVFREGEKKQCAYRLSVNFSEDDMENMEWFSKWVNDVFVPEDVRTIQELIGYCLLPVNSAQEAFILVGEAGVGKSVFTKLLSAIFGNAYQELSVKELSENKFYTALVENKLVIYDDDLHTEALSETGVFKKLITANQEITAERKFANPYTFTPYCTIIANSNDMIKTLYDDSNGFYRRLHPLHVKDKPANRRNISNMAELVASEKEAVVKWALIGLKRVIKNKYKITWSERSKEYMGAETQKGIHFPDFFNIVFDRDENGTVTTEQIGKVYRLWCKKNAIQELSLRRLQNWIGANGEKYKIKKAQIGNKRLKGYSGIKIRKEWEIV